jgi:hypothetical protein
MVEAEQNRGWSGDERRSIPIHILTHVSEVMDRFRDEETQRHEKLENMIDNTNGRIDQLMRSIDAYTEKTEEVFVALAEAFPVDRRGKPDFIGHANAHEHWITEAKESRELRTYIKKVVLAAAATAITSWLVAVVWPAFLRGPH